VADWKLEIVDDGEDEPAVTPREDLRRYGPLALAFLLGWLAATFVRLPFPLPD
jgi:hypothetical protein